MKQAIFKFYLLNKCAADLIGAIVIGFICVFGIVIVLIVAKHMENAMKQNEWSPPTISYEEWRKIK